MIELSIKRPVFITCLFVLVIIVGLLSLSRLSVDLFPNINLPIVRIIISYPGAGPQEIETLISKPVEDELASMSGLKALRSINQEGTSIVIAEFRLEMDIKYAEQQIRDRVSKVKSKLPQDIKEPIISRIDPADQPVLRLAIKSALPPAELYDLADQTIKPRIEQVNQVGLVEIVGGRKREIRVEMDLNKLSSLDLSAAVVRNRLGVSGRNTPAGKLNQGDTSTVIRTLGEFKSLAEIKSIPLLYANISHPIELADIADVKDDLEEEKTRTFISGEPGVVLTVYRQSGANTVEVVDNVISRVKKINSEIEGQGYIRVVQDGAKPIRANITDVRESIFLGIALTILVVFVFLTSVRSTLITSMALPNSLLGAFILMSVAGFSINIMTLLALSLAVGLLIDDAIVVRENIFRHLEMGKSPRDAALDGTKEVLLAVIATTLTVVAVFGPIGFLQGVIGQFFKEFGLTICFAMMISLADALTMAPMLSAHFAGTLRKRHGGPQKNPGGFFGFSSGLFAALDSFQTSLEDSYVRLLKVSLQHKVLTLIIAAGIFLFSIVLVKFVPKTFLPPQDIGEFMVALDMPPGTSLEKMSEVSYQVDKMIRTHREVALTVLTVGDSLGSSNEAGIFISMVPSKKRKINTTDFKEKIRKELKRFSYANPIVRDQDKVGGGPRPFSLNIVGANSELLEKTARKVYEKLKDHPALQDPDISYRPGKPEVQVYIDPKRAAPLGVLNIQIGDELRALIEGVVPAVYRENGREYDIRIRLKESQRDLKKYLSTLRVPNMNNQMTYLKLFADLVETQGPTTINREDRVRYVGIYADINPHGPGMGGAINDVVQLLEKDDPLPKGISYRFIGQAQNFKELMANMLVAVGLGIIFIYMVLASLYESFVIPLTIMMVLPLAACGAFFALFFTGQSLNIFSMIGCVMLFGIATKNSILLVDYILQMERQGMGRTEAILKAGKTRLRPILMTSFALISGMLPIALGLNEAAKQRTGMGIAIIGGLISSTLLTLVVVPAVYVYIQWTTEKLWSLFAKKAV